MFLRSLFQFLNFPYMCMFVFLHFCKLYFLKFLSYPLCLFYLFSILRMFFSGIIVGLVVDCNAALANSQVQYVPLFKIIKTHIPIHLKSQVYVLRFFKYLVCSTSEHLLLKTPNVKPNTKLEVLLCWCARSCTKITLKQLSAISHVVMI